MSTPRVLVVSFSDLASDPRVDRQLRFLEPRYRVVAAGLAPPACDVDEFVDLSTTAPSPLHRVVRRGWMVARRFEDAYWKEPRVAQALTRLAGIRADAIVANDLEALPIALRLGPPVVFDAHEYAPLEFDQVRRWRLFVAPYALWHVRRFVPQVAAMTTVGNGIAEEYERATGVRAIVVTNAPAREALEPSAVGERIRVLHHGAAIPGRGLEGMIRVARLLDERFHTTFVLMDSVPGYRRRLIRLAGNEPRVRFVPPQPMRELSRMANAYDIGLYLLQPVNFNNRFALPNKFFEFVQGRLALAIGPSPEMARIVREYGVGVVASDFRPETLARELNALDRDAIAGFKRASHVAADELCAERNQEIFLRVVQDALAHP
jgi:glycosyltransferase involved in cell wall biosynthesis